MPSTPIRDAARAAEYLLDDAQLAAAEQLEDLLDRVSARPGRRHPEAGGGAYLWGPVGRGKTWLLDRFHGLAGGQRFHFHEFYRALHAEVWARTGTADAMDRALDALLGDARVLCFDELHLHDAGDATLLSRALRTLLGRGVTLVATSNYPPEGLLPDPLFHELAEPLIDLLESRLDVLRVDGPVDYRELEVPDGAVWFDFAGLCAAPVSALDMLSLADRYGRWVVSEVVPFADCHRNTQQRFVSLVDVLYDRDLSLVLTAPRPLDELFWLPAGRPAPPDLARARSRLRQLRQTAHMSGAHER
jgi:cell division protein ZapE